MDIQQESCITKDTLSNFNCIFEFESLYHNVNAVQ